MGLAGQVALDRKEMRWKCIRTHRGRSEIEFDCELHQSRIVACRNNAAKVAGIADNSAPVWIDRCCRYGAKAANRIREVDVIEQVEKLSSQLNAFGLPKWKPLDH